MPVDPRSQHRIWRRRWQQEARCTKYITTSWKELQTQTYNEYDVTKKPTWKEYQIKTGQTSICPSNEPHKNEDVMKKNNND